MTDREDYLMEIKSEIDDVLNVPSIIRPDDITIKDMMKMYDVSDKKAKRLMEDMKRESDDWDLIKVKSNQQSRPIWVLRKKSPT